MAPTLPVFFSRKKSDTYCESLLLKQNSFSFRKAESKLLFFSLYVLLLSCSLHDNHLQVALDSDTKGL